ncbi:MAG: hypothetical protein OXB84_01805, partial [Halobacteriovoraceae bacterium]|nr:hypothetical protein [Halobacteriovoraceae bacterium]
MKMKIFLSGLLALIFLNFLPKTNASPLPPLDEWPKLRMEDIGTLQQLCEYDKQCEALKDHRGNIKFPHPLLLKIFWLQKDDLASIAKKYGIHPLIPMAAIATEHSLNLAIENQTRDNLVAAGFATNKNILGLKAVPENRPLYDEMIMNAEQIVAPSENRRRPGDSEYIGHRTFSIEGIYQYVAALMLYYTETYAKAGVDIANKPGILTSLYSIGRVADDTQPRVNYFGRLVLRNWEVFEAIYNEEEFDLDRILDLRQSLEKSDNNRPLRNLFGMFGKDRTSTFTTTKEVLLRDNFLYCDHWWRTSRDS